MKVTEYYFEREQYYREKYGENTILLMQVGSFFEVYGKKSPNNSDIFGSKISEFTSICDMNMSESSNQNLENIDEHGNTTQCNVIKAGFRDYSIDKYIDKIVNANYNCIIYEQDENLDRKCTQIITAGTHFDTSSEVTTNNIMVISLFHQKPTKYNINNNFIYGVANIDVLSGESNIFETSESYYNNLTTFDELEKNYSVYRPNELIVIYESENIDTNMVNDIIQYISCVSKTLRLINLSDTTNPLSKDAVLFKKEKYKIQTIKQYYPLNFENIEQNMYESPIAYESFCFLLDYIHKHNEHMSNSLIEPKHEYSNEKMVLANHSLKQLNIINTSSDHNDNNSSLLKFLNKCITPMGKRRFKYDLVNPINDIVKLEREYNIIDDMIKNQPFWCELTRNFHNFKDTDKLFRKITLLRAVPSDIGNIYNSILSLKEIHKELLCQTEFLSFSPFEHIFEVILAVINKMETKMRSTFDITRLCCGDDANNFDINFFNTMYDTEINDIECNYIESVNKLDMLMEYYSNIIKSTENKAKKDCYLKIKETNKSGIFIKLSDTRCKKLIKKINDISKTNDVVNFKSDYDNESKSFNVFNGDLKMEKSGSDSFIRSKLIDSICHDITFYKKALKEILIDNFKNILKDLSKYSDEFSVLSKFIVAIDVRYNKAKLSVKYNYCKPVVSNMYQGESFLSACQMRHPLIENIITNELYVPNDIDLTPDEKGILLFGTNAVGKSSLIKSIGMSIIMAQSGMYVPCTSFVFNPFKSIFTRILGNDNIFKGLSTFAVEMSELRTILKYSTLNSLVLGDELCSGTELGSAISIFVAGLMQLYKRDVKYIFATHFHEITDMPEICDLDKMKMKHMSVFYDAALDSLRYDRILRDGPGNNMYGLEVCKSLNLPQDFLDLANSIREKKFSKITKVSDAEGSSYNMKKLRTNCEMCGKKSSEVHHLQHQKNAGTTNHINHFHKNHVANLMNVCGECHSEFHNTDTEYKRVKTTKGYIVVPIENNKD